MAWTTPRTWSIGQLVNAADLNEQIRDNLNHLIIAVDTGTGKIPAISSTYFSSLAGTNITGIVKTNVANDFTAGVQNFNGGSGTRLVVPIGADKWAT